MDTRAPVIAAHRAISARAEAIIGHPQECFFRQGHAPLLCFRHDLEQ
ncbi:MAG: hypothetical protein G4V63_28715 [Candidatus Afipia apatlaquensis]|uniref:Uncharacterized protein n=1 Tax=Candidatus Afipia apatlaquensis TaxID=2712852 RepID=A0A7C9RKI5_9BRAD|nr:hypothetical protein [Candidatus Afipia apatlaquensis]